MKQHPGSTSSIKRKCGTVVESWAQSDGGHSDYLLDIRTNADMKSNGGITHARRVADLVTDIGPCGDVQSFVDCNRPSLFHLLDDGSKVHGQHVLGVCNCCW